MFQKVRENIRVAVIHGPGDKLRPVWFEWNRQKHGIKEVTYHWRHHAGSELILHYSVTDGTALFELVYNAARQLWVLEGVDADKP